MADNVKGEMIRGQIDTVILLALTDGDKDSNEIRVAIEEKSGNQYSVKQGTFYSAMQRLVKQGYIKEYRSSAIDGIRRKYYSLTPKGNKYLDKNREQWSASKALIDNLMDSETPVTVKETTPKVEEVDEFEKFKELASKSEVDSFEIDKPIDDNSYFDRLGNDVLAELNEALLKLEEESSGGEEDVASVTDTYTDGEDGDDNTLDGDDESLPDRDDKKETKDVITDKNADNIDDYESLSDKTAEDLYSFELGDDDEDDSEVIDDEDDSEVIDGEDEENTDIDSADKISDGEDGNEEEIVVVEDDDEEEIVIVEDGEEVVVIEDGDEEETVDTDGDPDEDTDIETDGEKDGETLSEEDSKDGVDEFNKGGEEDSPADIVYEFEVITEEDEKPTDETEDKDSEEDSSFAEDYYSDDEEDDGYQVGEDWGKDDSLLISDGLATNRREYKTILNKLFPQEEIVFDDKEKDDVSVTSHNADAEDDYDETPTEEETEEKTKVEDPKDEKTETIIATRYDVVDRTNKSTGVTDVSDFSDLYSMANREGFKIRTSTNTNRFSGTEILLNKLRMHSAFLFWALLLVEGLVLNFALTPVLEWNPNVKFIILGCLTVFPIISLIIYLINSKSSVYDITSFKDAMGIALIITFQMAILILCVALFVAVDFNDFKEVTTFILLPFVLAINIPVYFMLKYSLLATGKYFTD